MASSRCSEHGVLGHGAPPNLAASLVSGPCCSCGFWYKTLPYSSQIPQLNTSVFRLPHNFFPSILHCSLIPIMSLTPSVADAAAETHLALHNIRPGNSLNRESAAKLYKLLVEASKFIVSVLPFCCFWGRNPYSTSF